MLRDIARVVVAPPTTQFLANGPQRPLKLCVAASGNAVLPLAPSGPGVVTTGPGTNSWAPHQS